LRRVESTQAYRISVTSAPDGPKVALAFVEDWLDRPQLRHLVEQDGGSWPQDGALVDRLRALHDFSQRWNFRRGKERLQIAGGDASDIDPDDVMANAAALGMTTESPPRDQRYDHAIVLGGTALANLNRLRYLDELIAGGLEVGRVVALTALRKLPDDELGLVRERRELAALVDGAATEFDVFVTAASKMFGGEPNVTRHEHENPDLSGARAEIGSVSVLAAPSADGKRRADTSDNYAVYASEIHDGDSVLIVTSSIYLPYQFFVGLRALALSRSGTVEAVGFPPAWMGGVLTGPTNVLQELRSAFYGALNLTEAAS
jgi:hypothetical protein